MFPIPNPSPTSLPVPSLWVIPVHQPQASCILHRTWTGDSFLIWQSGDGGMNWEIGIDIYTLSSVQFSRSVVSDSLRPHESQYARPPCPSPTPGVHSDSRHCCCCCCHFSRVRLCATPQMAAHQVPCVLNKYN